MKKLVFVIAVAVICAVLFCSCDTSQLSGTYTFGEGVDTSTVTLNKDGSFEFSFSPISSYLGIGKFSVKGDTLTLETDDGAYCYVFRITDEGLVFDEDASSDMRWFGKFADGDVFK